MSGLNDTIDVEPDATLIQLATAAEVVQLADQYKFDATWTRDELIVKAVAAGYSRGAIALVTGLSPGRITQIVAAAA